MSYSAAEIAKLVGGEVVGDSHAILKGFAPAERAQAGDLVVLTAGAKDQQILSRSGDDLRIEWGYLYLAAPAASGVKTTIGSSVASDDGRPSISRNMMTELCLVSTTSERP